MCMLLCAFVCSIRSHSLSYVPDITVFRCHSLRINACVPVGFQLCFHDLMFVKTVWLKRPPLYVHVNRQAFSINFGANHLFSFKDFSVKIRFIRIK